VVPFGSYQFGEIDNVNLGTGALNVRIPILARKGRGMDYERVSLYSSKMWEVEPRYDPLTNEINGIAWYPNQSVGGFPSGPLRSHLEFKIKDYVCESNGEITEHVAYNFVYFSPDGAQTRFPNRDYWSTRVGYPGEGFICGNSPVSRTDYPVGQSESGVMELNTTNSTYLLRFKDGGVQTFFSRGSYGAIKDTNGNFVSSQIISTWPSTVDETDTAGRRYREIYTPTGYLTATDTLAQINTSGNAIDAGYQFNYSSTPWIATQFQETLLGGGFHITNWSGYLGGLSSISLPNGKTYTFTYNSQFGELAHIGLPTGGSIDYVFDLKPKFDDNPSYWAEALDSRRLVTRTVSDGLGHSYAWHYSYSRGWTGDPTGYVTTVTDPNGNVTIHYFDDRGIHEMATEVRQGQYTAKRSVTNQWTYDIGPVTWPDADASMEEDGLRDYRITSTTAKLLDVTPNLVSLTETFYDTFTYSYGASQMTGTRMNVASTKEYDYGSGANGGLVRRVVNTYLHDSDYNYQSKHIVDRLLTRRVYADLTEGSLKARTEIEYDSSDLAIAGTSGAAQHDYTNYGSGFRYRGNPTRTKTWLDTNGSWLTATNWYDDLGNRIKTQEPRFTGTGTYTYFYYSDQWTNSTCAPLSGNGSYTFVTHVQNALNQHSYSYYNSCQGQVGSVRRRK